MKLRKYLTYCSIFIVSFINIVSFQSNLYHQMCDDSFKHTPWVVMGVRLLCLVFSIATLSSGSQRLGKTMYSLGIGLNKKLTYPKKDHREVVLLNLEEYNRNLKYLTEEINKGNTTKDLPAAKFVYRKGIPRFAKMMFNPKMLQTKFDWNNDDWKRFYDLHKEASDLFKQFTTVFQLKIAGGRYDWTPKPDVVHKITTYKVKKRKIKEIITG